ncbi:MAG: hypothetical protein BWY71_02034 [Planctomycetes bacterium ADurb.Bin412]|nr:MAG: hypothetical protein BWY71_02034 [Planctomycetes bacterium ADurb.Bin412]
MPTRAPISRPAVGSSRIIRLGWETMARAIRTRICSPVDNFPNGWNDLSARFKAAISRSTRCQPAGGTVLYSGSTMVPNKPVATRVRTAISLSNSGTRDGAISPIFSRTCPSSTCPNVCPKTRTVPWVGQRYPVMMAIRDDLPAPLGPMTAQHCPCCTERLISRSRHLPSTVRDTFAKWMASDVMGESLPVYGFSAVIHAALWSSDTAILCGLTKPA